MVSVKKLRKADVVEMISWGKHKDVRLLHYNFDYDTKEDLLLWYKAKSKFLRKYIFGIYENDKMLGYVTLKNINWFFRKAEMGIVLNPSIVGKGVGKKAIKKYLDIAFKNFKMRVIYLKVASFNKRAINCYQGAGFIKYKEKYEKYEEQDELLIDNRYKNYSEMVFKNGYIYTKYEYMMIKNEL